MSDKLLPLFVYEDTFLYKSISEPGINGMFSEHPLTFISLSLISSISCGEKMEGKPINYFSSPLNFEKEKASPPYSLSDKGRYADPLSDRDKIIYEDKVINASSALIFS